MPRPKSTDTEATRQAIASMAEDLFRTLGYHKTTLADITSRLGMSPANIYRFFRSKQDIVAAICDRFVSEYEATWPASVKAKATATKNLAAYFLACHRYMRAHFLANQGIYEMLEVALEQNWPVMLKHVERMTDFADSILKRGVARGEFQDDTDNDLAWARYERDWEHVTRDFRRLTGAVVRLATSPIRPLIVPVAKAAPGIFESAVERLAR